MEQLRLESQQLVEILVQLGFKKQEDVFDYDYINNELNLYWDYDDGFVWNVVGDNGFIPEIDEKSIATNIAYFQKQLDKKLNQESQNASN